MNMKPEFFKDHYGVSQTLISFGLGRAFGRTWYVISIPHAVVLDSFFQKKNQIGLSKTDPKDNQK